MMASSSSRKRRSNGKRKWRRRRVGLREKMRRAELSRVMRVTLRDIPLFALFCLRFRRDSFISPESEAWEEGCGGWWSFDCSLWLWCHLFFLIGSIVCSSVF